MQTMLRFAVPMILGDLLQQCYNIADTLIVGRYLGESALAAVGSAFSLMTFLTSIILGLAMGSGTVFSIRYGQKDEKGLKEGILASFALLASVTVILNILVFAGLDLIIWFLRTPEELVQMMRDYLSVIFAGLVGIFLYNFFASLLRSLGNSVVPLAFLAVSACLNIVLDLWFVTGLHRGVAGAAEATVIAQAAAGLGIAGYTLLREPLLPRPGQGVAIRRSRMGEILSYAAATGAQQSVMNFGILMIQGLVNSFGTAVMAAFAAGVKIDTLAYMPAQEFGNAYSIFTSQNYGAGNLELIRKGYRYTRRLAGGIALAATAAFLAFSREIFSIFIDSPAVVEAGSAYLRILAVSQMFYALESVTAGVFNRCGRTTPPAVTSILLTAARIPMAYWLVTFPALGMNGIWWSISLSSVLKGSVLAVWYYFFQRRLHSARAPFPRPS